MWDAGRFLSASHSPAADAPADSRAFHVRPYLVAPSDLPFGPFRNLHQPVIGIQRTVGIGTENDSIVRRSSHQHYSSRAVRPDCRTYGARSVKAPDEVALDLMQVAKITFEGASSGHVHLGDRINTVSGVAIQRLNELSPRQSKQSHG